MQRLSARKITTYGSGALDGFVWTHAVVRNPIIQRIVDDGVRDFGVCTSFISSGIFDIFPYNRKWVELLRFGFAIYSRKSVYTGKGESIENQVEMSKQYIFSKFTGVTEDDITVYEDEGFSAKNTDRPKFQQMLKDIKQKKFDYIVCYRLDRISRNVGDFAILIEDLNDRNISFICIKEEFDTSKPMGKAMMYIASVFAQLERETIAERVRDNMLMLARTGRWLGGTTPTGFTTEKTQEIILDGKIKSACKLKTNPAEITTVSTIYEKFLELHSVSGVSKYLMHQGIKSRSDKSYSLPGIKEILQNPVYCIADKDALAYFMGQNADVCFKEKDCSDKFGLLSYNKRDYKKKSSPRQPIEKWIISIGKHKGIISGEKWAMVQSILDSNIPTGKQPAKMHNDYALLSGLIFCKKCGSRFFSRNRSANTALFDYVCSSKMHGGVQECNCQNLNGTQTDLMVCDYLLNYTDENSEIFKLLTQLQSNLNHQAEKNPVLELNDKITKCNIEIENLVRTLAHNGLSSSLISRVNTQIAAVDEKLAALTAQRSELQAGGFGVDDRSLQLDILTNTLSSLKNHFIELSIHEKRILIKLLIKKIIWDGKDLHIFMYGE